MTFMFGGLTAGDEYDLFAIMNSNYNGRTTDFAVSGTTQPVVTANSGSNAVTSPSVYTEFTNLAPSGAGQIVVTAYSPGVAGTEFDVNGFQLVPLTLAAFSWAGTSAANPTLWDSSTQNWSGLGGNMYSDGNNVVFSDSGTNINITVTSGGVSPASVLFTANTTPYSISGGAILGSASVALSGSGSMTFSNSNSYSGSTMINGGTLNLDNGAIAGGGTVTVGGNATLGGAGYIAGATVVNGSLSPSLSGPLSIANTLTLNGGSTFVLAASGGTVGSVQGVTTLNFGTGSVNLLAIALDGGGTLNGSSTYTFLTYASGPGPGVQTNWNVGGASTITWAGTGDGVNWVNIPNWSGLNVSGGTVTAIATGGGGAFQVSGLSVVANGPQSGSNVCIQSPGGVTVTGPAALASVRSLTLGSASGGLNTLNLGMGQLNVTGAAGTMVDPTGVLNVGSSFQTTSLSIAGTTNVVLGGSLAISGAVAVSSPGMLNAASGSIFQAASLGVSGGTVNVASAAIGVFSKFRRHDLRPVGDNRHRRRVCRRGHGKRH